MSQLRQCAFKLPHPSHDYARQSLTPFAHREYFHCLGVGVQPEPVTPHAPRRIQMSRQRPWRAEYPDAVIVARPSKLGNPFVIGSEVTIQTSTDIATILLTPEMAVACYRDLMASRVLSGAADDPDDVAYAEQWVTRIEALAGHDLACWCPLDQPCHADVLLELANR